MEHGVEVPGYDVEELLGVGGSGEVWRAVELATGETVALKLLREDSGDAIMRLRREAQLLEDVAGPHVVAVREVIATGRSAVLVLDHAAGGSLAGVLAARDRITPPEVVTVLAPLAGALDFAHQQGLVHGDVTPGNVLFTADGRPLLADFGVARLVAARPPAASGPQSPRADTPETEAEAEGTAGFLDPAVTAGEAPSTASDVYGLAAVGYVALCGRPPAPPVTAEEIVTAVPEAPERLAQALAAALASDPRDRPPARSFATALLLSSAAAPVRLPHRTSPTPLPATARPVRQLAATEPEPDEPAAEPGPWRRRLVAGVAVLAVLAGAVAVGRRWASSGDAPGAAPVAAPASAGPSAPSPAAADLPPATAATPTAPPAPPAGSAVAATVAPARPAPPVTGVAGTGSRWEELVRRLEAERAASFAAADASRLDAVYAPGSPALAADRATVDSLAGRGLRVAGFSPTVEQVRLLRRTPSQVTVRVVDRLSGYRLVDARGRVAGSGAPRPDRVLTMTLLDVRGRWLVGRLAAT